MERNNMKSMSVMEARRRFHRQWSLESVPEAVARLAEVCRALGPERCRQASLDLLGPSKLLDERPQNPDRLGEAAARLLYLVGRVVGEVRRNLTYGTFEDLMRLVCRAIAEGVADPERIRSGVLAVLAKYDTRFVGA